MRIIINLLISIAIAAAATALTAMLTGSGHAVPILFFAFCAATVTTALLVSVTGGRTAAAPDSSSGKGKKKTQRATKTPSAKATSRDVPQGGPREHGQVKWFNVSKGFGFITKDDGEEIFVHFRSIRGGGRRGLSDGQAVSFIVANSDKGPQAEDVEGLD